MNDRPQKEHRSLADAGALREILRDLFAAQNLAVMATQSQGQPYTNLMAFVASEDLKHLFFATSRATRKYGNLKADSRVALMVDNRQNRADDFRGAVAVTALGRAEEIPDGARDEVLALYLAKHPHLREFVTAPNCAIFDLKVSKFEVVQRFQNVVEIEAAP